MVLQKLLVPFEGFFKKKSLDFNRSVSLDGNPNDREELEMEHLTVMPVTDANVSGDPKDILR